MMWGGQAMRTGNPALGDNTFTAVGRVARADEAMTIQGTANKALLAAAVRPGDRLLGLEQILSGHEPPGGNSLGGGGSHRRVHRGPGHHLQADLGPRHRPPLRPAGRVGHRRRLRPVRGPIPRHRHPGRGLDLGHLPGHAAGLQIQADPGHRKLQDGSGGGHRRHRPLLSHHHGPGLFRDPDAAHVWRTVGPASASACSWSSLRP